MGDDETTSHSLAVMTSMSHHGTGSNVRQQGRGAQEKAPRQGLDNFKLTYSHDVTCVPGPPLLMDEPQQLI